MTEDKKRIVIKIGTSILTRRVGSPLVSLVGEIASARARGAEILLVTSGAIGAGMEKLNWSRRPAEIRKKQAVAAIGQVALMQTYEKLFKIHQTETAQVLLSRSDFDDRTRYLNARNTLFTLLELGVVPIINENDTVAVEEIRFGDNDNLSALVAAKIDAELLVILTDVDGLYRSGTEEVIPLVSQITPEIEKHAGKKSKSGLGTGGMASKIAAAKIATDSGVTTVVANGFRKNVISDILDGKTVGTKFIAKKTLSAKEKWILFGARSKGEIWIDSGAANALKHLKKSLLPAGILNLTGAFSKGDVIKLKTEDGTEIARGIVSYSAEEIQRIRGKKSAEIKKVLDSSANSFEVVHRDSLVLIS